MNTIYVSCRSFGKGGAERVLSVLSTAFANHYDYVVYLFWHKSSLSYEIDKRAEVVWIPDEAKSDNIVKKMLWFRRYVREGRPTKVLSFLTPTNMITLAALKGLYINVFVSERADPHYYFKRYKMEFLLCRMRNYLYAKAKGIIVQSQTMKDYYKGKLGEKCQIIFNPIFMSHDVVGCGLKSEKKNRIISVGRLAKFKNQKMMISAFGRFLVSHPDYCLCIYGEGECRHELEQHIEAEGLAGKVLLPGSTNKVFECIKDAKMFVLSSNYEGLSNALIEAMCIGLPCVSTKVSGSTDIIENRVNGLLVECGDEEQLVNAMTEVADNEALAKMIAENATHLFDRLSIDAISNVWTKYLDKFDKNK